MTRCFVLLLTLFSLQLQATSIQVHSIDEDPFLLEGDCVVLPKRIREAIEEETGVPADEQTLWVGAPTEEARGYMTATDFFLESMDNDGDDTRAIVRVYENGMTEQDRSDIRFIVTTLGHESLSKIFKMRKRLDDAGDRILHVHPFRFLEVAFGSDETIVGIRNIKAYGSVLWKGFVDDNGKGLFVSLREEQAAGNLNQYVDDLAASLIPDHDQPSVTLDPELIRPSVESGNWDQLVDILIANMKRWGNPDDFDF